MSPFHIYYFLKIKKYTKIKKSVALFFLFAIIIMRKKNAAVVQRLVPMLAMHMMTVRFRSVAPYELLKAVKPFLFYTL